MLLEQLRKLDEEEQALNARLARKQRVTEAIAAAEMRNAKLRRGLAHEDLNAVLKNARATPTKQEVVVDLEEQRTPPAQPPVANYSSYHARKHTEPPEPSFSQATVAGNPRCARCAHLPASSCHSPAGPATGPVNFEPNRFGFWGGTAHAITQITSRPTEADVQPTQAALSSLRRCCTNPNKGSIEMISAWRAGGAPTPTGARLR